MMCSVNCSETYASDQVCVRVYGSGIRWELLLLELSGLVEGAFQGPQ